VENPRTFNEDGFRWLDAFTEWSDPAPGVTNVFFGLDAVPPLALGEPRRARESFA
jgi:hypothetical protein